MTSSKRQVRLDADVADAIEATRGDRSLSAATNLVLRETLHTTVQVGESSAPVDRSRPVLQPADGPRVAPPDTPGPNTPGSPEGSHTAVPGDVTGDPAQPAGRTPQAVRRAPGRSEAGRTPVRPRTTSTCRHPIGRRIGVYCAACGREVTA